MVALYSCYGHRISVDLDLFSTSPFDNEDIIPALEKNIKNFKYRNASNPIGLFRMVDNLKIDFIKHHHHPLIDKPLLIDGIRILSEKEMMAMKVAAILKRGVKKDFWDLNELFKHFTVEECIEVYTKKYATQELLISIPYPLTFFANADESEEPVSLKGQTWTTVKKSIQKNVNDYLK